MLRRFGFELRRLSAEPPQRDSNPMLKADPFADSLWLLLIALSDGNRTRRTMERQCRMSQNRWNEAYRTLKRAGVIDVGGQLTGMDCYQLTRLLVQREEEHRRVSVHGNFVSP